MTVVNSSTASLNRALTQPRPGIIIADRNRVRRARLARALADTDGALATTGSAACLMEQLLRGGPSVVVLGDGLAEGLTVAALIPLLKSCNPRLTIILAADEVSAAEEIKVRQQGIFYRITRPVCARGWDELLLAVECACNKVMLAAPCHRDAVTTSQGFEQP
jgi:DNA-binding NtrC family response regulator